MRQALAIVIALLTLLPVALAGVTPSYEEQVLAEIEHIRNVRLEEKKIEVLARLQQMNAAVTNNNISSNTSLHSYNKNISRTESVQNNRVSYE